MQFFKFIFLARSWASDRIELASHLSALGQHAEREDKPLTLFLYPEGTLVSKDTRPISKKFADKLGIVRLHTHSTMILLSDFVFDSFKAGYDEHLTSAFNRTALQSSRPCSSSAYITALRHHNGISR